VNGQQHRISPLPGVSAETQARKDRLYVLPDRAWSRPLTPVEQRIYDYIFIALSNVQKDAQEKLLKIVQMLQEAAA